LFTAPSELYPFAFFSLPGHSKDFATSARYKITPRRAAVMAYTANLLLRTLPTIARENGLQTQKEKVEPIVFDYSDWPDPGRLWH